MADRAADDRTEEQAAAEMAEDEAIRSRTVNTIGRADEMLNESSQGEAALVLASMFALVAGKDGDFSADELADAEELRTGALLIFNAEDSAALFLGEEEEGDDDDEEDEDDDEMDEEEEEEEEKNDDEMDQDEDEQ